MTGPRIPGGGEPGGSLRNLLPASDTFNGEPWVTFNDAEVERWTVRPLFPGTEILLHRRTTDADHRTMAVFGCRMINQVMCGEFYTASAWVWVPSEFRGMQVCVFCAGRPSLSNRRASLYPRDVWQLVWVTVQVPLEQTSLVLALGIRGDAGSEVHSTGWKLEAGQVHSNYLPGVTPAELHPDR